MKKGDLFLPIMSTIVALGPIGWFFIDTLIDKNYDRIILLYIFTIIVVIFCTWSWLFYFKCKENDNDKNSE